MLSLHNPVMQACTLLCGSRCARPGRTPQCHMTPVRASEPREGLYWFSKVSEDEIITNFYILTLRPIFTFNMPSNALTRCRLITYLPARSMRSRIFRRRARISKKFETRIARQRGPRCAHCGRCASQISAKAGLRA